MRRKIVFIKMLIKFLKGYRGRNKTSLHSSMNKQVTVAPKKEVEFPGVLIKSYRSKVSGADTFPI